jgi:dienelactone hydrolase
MADARRRQILLGGTAAFLSGCALTAVPDSEGSTSDVSHQASNRKSLLAVLGEMPSRQRVNLTVIDSVRLESGWRHKVEYMAEPTDPLFEAPPDMVRAFLFVPDHDGEELLPAIVAIHQDGPQSHIGKSEAAGLAGDKNQYYGLELFQKGYVVLCADRFGHAERRRVVPNDITSINSDRDDSLLNHRVGQLLLKGRNFIGKEVYDLMVGVDVLNSLSYVDKNRIGAIGHSAGGNSLAYFMFADTRVKVGVSSCGLFSMLRFFSEAAPKKRLAAVALPGLAKVGDSGDYLAGIAPRPILLTRGLWEWGKDGEDKKFSEAHVQETRDMESRARKSYSSLGASANLRAIYFDEDGGNHDFPPSVRREAYLWLDRTLKPKRGRTTAFRPRRP